MGADNTYGETNFNPDKANNAEIKKERHSSQLHFNSEIEAIEWVRSHTPFLIRAEVMAYTGIDSHKLYE
jgi:hypothetical protein